MIVVARDGSGDFTTIQEAVDSLPEKCDGAPREIMVRPGEYREKVVIHRDNVRLFGLDALSTVTDEQMENRMDLEETAHEAI